jgi:tripartite-type tricarboxylate transporter receptor subunit TctC
MKLSRRRFLHLGAGAAALPAVSRIAFAQAYPTRPVRIIVGFTAGSATDITARLFAQKLNEAWKTPVTVENIPGAGGSVGAERAAKSAPDGSTLYWGANGAMTINPSLLPSSAFDPARDLAPIARVLVMSSILAVNNEVPAKSVAELFVLAKAQPNARGVRLSGLRGHLLVRVVSAGRHAGRRRQQGACGHRADRRASRCARADRAARS